MDIYAESAVTNTELLPFGDATYQIVDEAAGGVIAYCHQDSAARIVAALIAEQAAAPERVNCVITHIETVPCDGGWASTVQPGNTFTPVRAELKEPLLTRDLRRVEGHDVALWLTREDANSRREIVQFNTFAKHE